MIRSSFRLWIALPLAAFVVVSGTEGRSSGPSSEILSEIRLQSNDADGNAINEISGLAWDADDQLLYAISDMGHVVSFKVAITGSQINSIDAVSFHDVSVSLGKKKFSDSEAIVVLNGDNGVVGDSNLAIAFEDGPAAALFTTNGELIQLLDLPEPLRNPDAYQSANKRIESMGYSEGRGFFFAPQVPLTGNAEDRHTLYFNDGPSVSFDSAEPRASDTKDVTALPDGSVIALEGADGGGFWSFVGLASPEMRLRRINLADCNSENVCPVKDYLPVAQSEMQDKFEGLAFIGGDKFLAATDETDGSRIVLLGLKE